MHAVTVRFALSAGVKRKGRRFLAQRYLCSCPRSVPLLGSKCVRPWFLGLYAILKYLKNVFFCAIFKEF